MKWVNSARSVENPQHLDNENMVKHGRKDNIPLPEGTEIIADNSSMLDGKDRLKYFTRIQKLLNSVVEFQDFQQKAKEFQIEIDNKFPLPSTLAVTQPIEVDLRAISLYPTAQQLPEIPVNIVGDGNCGPRVASQVIFGNQKFHIEIRVRIALEMALHENYYLQEENLLKGFHNTDLGKDLTKCMAQFMEVDVSNFKDEWSSSVLHGMYR